jgi:hypothetical protein
VRSAARGEWGTGSEMGSMGLGSRGRDLGEISSGPSAYEAYVITESTGRHAPKP